MNIKRLVQVLLIVSLILVPLLSHAAFTDELKIIVPDLIANDNFGQHVSISGETLIISVNGDDDNGDGSGSAYVFVRNPANGDWAEQAKLLASDGAIGDVFGSYVSISGDTALIGAAFNDDNGADSGSAYVFVRNPATGNWTQQAKLLATDGKTDDRLGLAVAISDDTAVVGSRLADNSNGVVYVFVRNPATGSWTQQAKLFEPNSSFLEQFGDSVSIDGDTLAIGASGNDDKGQYAGAVSIFTKNPATGVWDLQQKLLAADGAAGDRFGQSVSLKGDSLAVGATQDDDKGSDSGSAYIFSRNPSTGVWAQQQKLTASEGAAGDRFGYSVSIDNDFLAIGAAYNDDFFTYSGSTYIYVEDPFNGQWREHQKLLASDTALNANFGISVSLNGDNLVVGSYTDEYGINAGSAYVYSMASACAGLIENCGFEYPVPSNGAGNGWNSYDIGPYDSDGWVSTNCKEGSCFDLNGNSGQVPTIEQTVTGLTAGATYELTGDYAIYAYNWTCNYASLSDGQMAIDINGVNHVKLDPPGCTTSNITWGSFSTTFVAPSTDVTIAFRAQIDADTDYAIDNIALVEFVNPDITVTPTTHDFGDVTIGTQTDQTITITNDGNQDLVLGDLGATAPLAVPFSILNDTCTGKTLNPAASCTFNVRFAPTVLGAVSDAIDIPSNDPDENPVYINVSGSGTAITVPDIAVTDSVTPGSDLLVPFGNVSVGSSSYQTVTITNNGTADLILDFDAVINALSSPFNIRDVSCTNNAMAPGVSCTFDINFAPISVGQFSDTLDIPSNDPDENPVTISVSGTGTATTVPDITVTDAVAPNNDLQVPLGSITVGTVSDQTITVANSGNANLVLGAIATANPLSSPFSIENNACDGKTLTPAESCAFDVRFAPTATGVFNESFDIPSNDPDEDPVTVNVNGTGTAVLVPDITVTDTVEPFDDLKVLFGNVTEGLTSEQTITLSNDGNADLVIGSIAVVNPVAGPFAISNDICSGETLPPGTDCVFDVSFSPEDVSFFSDSLDIPSNDPDEGSLTVNLTGAGLSSVTNNPPDKPQLIFPANGQQGLSTTVTLKWLPVTDPDGDPVSYDVYYCTDSDPFSSCDAIQITSLNLQSIGGKPNGAVYYAGISYGTVMLFLGIAYSGRFRGKKRTALLVALIIAIGALLSACDDNDSKRVYYETYTVSDLDSKTQYYWGVVAKDGQGGETPSEVWSFTTE